MKHRFWRTAAVLAIACVTLTGTLFLLHSPGSAAAPQSIPSPAAPDHTAVISNAMAFLATQQATDGSFGGEFTTIRVVIATAAAQSPIDTFTNISGTTPVDYLASRAITYTHAMTGTGPLNPGRAGSLLVAAVAADQDPNTFGGMNLVQELAASYNPATGAFSTTTSPAGALSQWWSLLGMAAAQQTVPVTATNYLSVLQRADGGWGWGDAATSSDPDSTAFALQALLAAGNVTPQDPVILNGLQYLADLQHSSGGWEVWGAVSADTTAAVMQAFAAAGYTPVTGVLLNSAGKTPHDAMVNLQAADGSFPGWLASLSTADAIMGLAEAPLPIPGRVGRANLALSWMETLLLPDNSWPSAFGGREGGTIDAVLAYVAAGYDPTTLHASGPTTSPMDYLAEQAATYAARGPDAAGKLAFAVEAAGDNAANFGGVNLIHTLSTVQYSATSHAFGVPTNTWHQAWGILGLAGAGEALPAGVTDTLKGLQQADGGWKYDLGPWSSSSGPDNTGLAVQALIAAGLDASDPAIISATAYLHTVQNTQGGWDGWAGLDASSTAFAIQGLMAAGEDLWSPTWCRGPSKCAIAALESLQKPDGPFTSGGYDDFFATRQAILALVGAPFLPASRTLAPFASVPRGSDPDRLVVGGDPTVAWSNSIDVSLPFGSDLDGDAAIALDYRTTGSTSWITGTALFKSPGLITATIPVTQRTNYEIQFRLTDMDGVDNGTDSGTSLTISASLNFVFLPVIMK